MPEATPADFELGRAALLEITPAETIGAPAGSVDEGDGVVSVYFEADMLGYPGWRWTASIAHVEGSEPTVLETEMMPGEDSLLAPEWIPWVDRLADYRAAQDVAAEELEGSAVDELDDEDIDEFDDDDDDDLDDTDLDSEVLHAGDLDGVDIDDIDDDSDDDDDSGEESDDDDSVDSVSAVSTVRVDESDQAESDTDGAGQQPPAVTAVDEGSEKKE